MQGHSCGMLHKPVLHPKDQIVVGVFEKISKISKPLTKLEGTEDSNP